MAGEQQKFFWHALSVEQALAKLKTTEEGLGRAEAEKRLAELGENKLPEAKKQSLFLIFFEQFQSPLIYILLIAAAIVTFLGEYTDAFFIVFVLLFNAIVGTIQEGRAQNTLAALKRLVKTNALVRRDGKENIIASDQLVPGDIVLLREGDRVPADMRIIEAQHLRLDEASLTGESTPVVKNEEAIDKEDVPAFERKNIVFFGTAVVAGSAVGAVVATGVMTEIGKIGQAITKIDTEIPLKENIRNLSKLIIFAVLGISAFLFGVGLYQERGFREVFATVVSLAVSVVPEGLPIVVTLVLATGVWRMAKRNALVKKLQAVEALGQAKVIAVDKTGTVTKNQMMVTRLFVDNKMFEVTGEGYHPKGEFLLQGERVNFADHEDLLFSGKLLTLCANAQIHELREEKEPLTSGDPTEVAMLVLGYKLGFNTEALHREYQKMNELPFDYKSRFHGVFYKETKSSLADGAVKVFFVITGAPEVILENSKTLRMDKKTVVLQEQERKKIEEIFMRMSEEGFRVIAMAMAEFTLKKDETLPALPPLTFVGICGIQDTIRPEATEAVVAAENAGMRVVMITGDHPLTAKFIARQVKIFREGDEIMTGRELDAISEEELAKRLDTVSVFARVTPEHKIKIIDAFKKKKLIVAMTGDGVNDALSLVDADLGVAMGKIGTEVAKEAADIVLLDDNFGSIVAAAEEGRSIYKTLKKVILYLFSTSLGEVFVIGGAMLVGWPLPLLPAQIIWLNLVTDGFLTVALAMEPKEDRLLSQQWKKPNKYLIDALSAQRMIMMGLVMGLFTLVLFPRYLYDIQRAWTVALTILAVLQWWNAWNCRSERKSIFQQNPFSNVYLVGAIGIIVVLQLFAVYHPFMQDILRTKALNIYDWFLIMVLSLPILLVEELRKVFYRAYLKLKKQ